MLAPFWFAAMPRTVSTAKHGCAVAKRERGSRTPKRSFPCIGDILKAGADASFWE
jgi:hypothetical protein